MVSETFQGLQFTVRMPFYCDTVNSAPRTGPRSTIRSPANFLPHSPLSTEKALCFLPRIQAPIPNTSSCPISMSLLQGEFLQGMSFEISTSPSFLPYPNCLDNLHLSATYSSCSDQDNGLIPFLQLFLWDSSPPIPPGADFPPLRVLLSEKTFPTQTPSLSFLLFSLTRLRK